MVLKTYRYFSGFITELPENGVFVFGANVAGRHGAGAAKTAMEKFGAVYGQTGLMGTIPGKRSYGLITVDLNLHERMSLEKVEQEIDKFYDIVASNPELDFYLTPVGIGLAGFSSDDVAIYFSYNVKNLIFPVEFAGHHFTGDFDYDYL